MNKLVSVDIEVSKKELYESKKAINLSSGNAEKISVSNKIKGNNETSKIFIGYLDDISCIVAPLYIILPQMSGGIKYFEGGGKNMSFKIENGEVYIKYSSIWNKIKELLGGIKLYGELIYDNSYIKTKVKTFGDMIKALFDGGYKIPDKIPK